MLLLEFRTITNGRWRRARWTFFLIVAGALALYALTTVQYAFPGQSASWIAWMTGLDVLDMPKRPLLTLLGKAVSQLPWGSLALRMNLLAALAGALTVGWVFKVVWFLVFDLMNEESAVTDASRNARFGGLVAAATVAVSLPFWQASTRFSPVIFDVALIMGCAHLLTIYARSQNVLWLLLFGAVIGGGIAESSLVLVAAPLLAAFAVLTEWKLFWCRIDRLFGAAILAFLVLFTIHFFAARSFALAYGLPNTHAELFRLVVSVLREQVYEITGLLPKTLWLPMLALGAGSALLSFLLVRHTLDNRRTWGLLLLSVLLTVSTVLMLLNVPITPWAVLAPKGVMPAMAYVLAGISTGLLVASWRALSVLKDPLDVEIREEDDDEQTGIVSKPAVFMISRMAGFMLVPILLVLIAVCGLANGFRLVADNGSYADQAADVVLDSLQGRTWVVANGLIDPNLQIRASERGLAVHLICPYRAADRVYTASLLQSVMRDAAFSPAAKLRAESLIAYNIHLFIDDFFSSDEAIGHKAVCMGLPDIWYGSGWVPMPELFFYGGVKNANQIDPDHLLALQRQFWQKWDAFLKEGDGSPKQLSYRHRKAVRKHLAFIANNLGVTLGDAGKEDAAFSVYLKAHAISPENISALLNIFDLVSRGCHPEMKEAIESELRGKVDNGKERYSLWALSRNYGYVRNYELFVRMGWSWAISSSPGSVLAGLRSAYSLQQDEDRRAALTAMLASVYEMRGDFAQSETEYKKTIARDPKNTFAISGLVRLAIQQSVVGEAQKVLNAGALAGVLPRMLRQDWAAVYLVSGDLPRARVILQELGDESNASPMTLAMLAMVMIEQQDMANVEAKVLPRLTKMTDANGAYFSEVVQGRVWQSKGKSGYRNARLWYLRAAALRPDVKALKDMILMLDVSLEEQKSAEAHALSILRQRPDHPYANFIIGSIRLEQGQYGDAETYLRRSCGAAEPTLAALNNFAQVLCRIRKLDEAEAVARRATSFAPDRYEAWSTLAFVLATRDRIDDASAALAKAFEINSHDPRLMLVDGLISVKRGDRAAAEKAAAAVATTADLSVADRFELKSLQEAIERLRRTKP